MEKQRNIPREQDITSVKDLNEMKINDTPDNSK